MIYPNPCDGQFYSAQPGSWWQRFIYRLTDVYGNEISGGMLQTNNNETIRFNFHFLKDGIYFIEIFDDESRIFSGKLIIKK